MEAASFVPGLTEWQHIDRQGTRVDKGSEVGKVMLY